jgi:hypothetical protein
MHENAIALIKLGNVEGLVYDDVIIPVPKALKVDLSRGMIDPSMDISA